MVDRFGVVQLNKFEGFVGVVYISAGFRVADFGWKDLGKRGPWPMERPRNCIEVLSSRKVLAREAPKPPKPSTSVGFSFL